jgi:hypothetical protein
MSQGMWVDLLVALSLVFVLEGMLPFLNPESARKLFSAMANLDDQTLRFGGLTSMLLGVVMLYLIR